MGDSGKCGRTKCAIICGCSVEIAQVIVQSTNHMPLCSASQGGIGASANTLFLTSTCVTSNARSVEAVNVRV